MQKCEHRLEQRLLRELKGSCRHLATSVDEYLSGFQRNSKEYKAAIAYCSVRCGLTSEAVDELCSLISDPLLEKPLKIWARDTVIKLAERSVEDIPPPPIIAKKRYEKLIEHELLTVRGDSSSTQIEQLEKMVRNDPENVMLLDWLAFSCYRDEDFAKAISFYERLIKLQAPRDSDLYYLGSANLTLMRVDSAVAWWRRLAHEFPKSKLINRVVKKLKTIRSFSRKSAKEEVLQLTTYEQGDGSGLAEVEALLANDPNDISILDWAAFANYTLGDHKRAKELYTRLLELDEENIQAHYYLANCLYGLKSYENACFHWRQVVKLSPKHRLASKAKKRLACQ